MESLLWIGIGFFCWFLAGIVPAVYSRLYLVSLIVFSVMGAASGLANFIGVSFTDDPLALPIFLANFISGTVVGGITASIIIVISGGNVGILQFIVCGLPCGFASVIMLALLAWIGDNL